MPSFFRRLVALLAASVELRSTNPSERYSVGPAEDSSGKSLGFRIVRKTLARQTRSQFQALPPDQVKVTWLAA